MLKVFSPALLLTINLTLTQWYDRFDPRSTSEGLPKQEVHFESFNGKLRNECLNETLFSSLADAKEKLEAWQEDYNRHRPHSALRNLTPMEFAEKMKMDKLAA